MLMFAIRRRWPILTAVIATLFYVVNNYQISGLEHLRVAPLDRPGQKGYSDSGSASDFALLEGFGFDLTQLGIQRSPALGAHVDGSHDLGIEPQIGTSLRHQPAWKDLLSPGEKLALWQDKIASSARVPTGSVDSIGPTLPISSPIPIPHGMEPGLPSSDVATSRFIRIASFKIPGLGPDILAKPHVLQTLIGILRQYDLIALQGIQTTRDDILPLISEKLNQTGRGFDFMIGPRVGRSAPHHQFAFVFDTSKLETDRYQLYTLDDPEDLITYEPLVAWFRCRGIAQKDAFTFSLVNVSIDSNFAQAERAVLPALIEAVQNDGRLEDDWILAGDFAGGIAELSSLNGGGVRLAISDIPTDVVGTQVLDTILFSTRATTEFTGRAGAFDFLRKYNLSIERALEISSHMPVWAEFSSIEGSEPGRIAPVPPQPVF